MSTSESSNTGSLASRIVTATAILAIPVGTIVYAALQATGGDVMLALEALAGAGMTFLAVGLAGYAIVVAWRSVRGPIMAALGFVGRLVVGMIPIAIVGLVYHLLPELAGQVFLGIVVAAVVLAMLFAFGQAASQ